MSEYGEIAVYAAGYVHTGMTPREAWEKASRKKYPSGSSMQTKGCPRAAFLGLCGVNQRSLNAQYALSAYCFLTAHGSAVIDTRTLWNIVMGGRQKQHNGQMDVVLALFNKGFKLHI